jgi:hypothetical protein
VPPALRARQVQQRAALRAPAGQPRARQACNIDTRVRTMNERSIDGNSFSIQHSAKNVSVRVFLRARARLFVARVFFVL